MMAFFGWTMFVSGIVFVVAAGNTHQSSQFALLLIIGLGLALGGVEMTGW